MNDRITDAKIERNVVNMGAKGNGVINERDTV